MSDIKSVHVAPGDNSVIRLVVMEFGTRHVYWKDKLLGSIGDDDSLVATLEGLVDETWDRSASATLKGFIEEISKPKNLNALKMAGFVETLQTFNLKPRKKFLGLF